MVFGVGPERWADGGGDGGNKLTNRIVYTHIEPAAYSCMAAGKHSMMYDCMLTRHTIQYSKPEDSPGFVLDLARNPSTGSPDY